LLGRLSAKDREHVLAQCEEVDLPLGKVISDPGETIRDIYFPTDSFISLLVPMGGKNMLEVALVGNEGVHGFPVALGVGESLVHAQVQGAGPAWRMSPAAFRRELSRVPKLRDCVDGYIHVLTGQLIQTAGCNRYHVVEQRVARWFLMTADRAHSATFHITHEFLACMLGVRRVGITEAAGALQDRKLISYSRGLVSIMDRKGLERSSCACYRTDLTTYGRVFG
jgi:CRP-like cAMP-binding protein